MSKHLKAVYENGVFRPLEPVALAEHEEVVLQIRSGQTTQAAESERSCYDLAEALGLIGAADDLPTDLSTDKAYFQGFGGK